MTRPPASEQQLILVCFALREEAAPFRRLARRNPSVRVFITGMGKRNTETAIRVALERWSPTLVLTCGFAGALAPEFSVGTVLFEGQTDTPLAHNLEQLGAKAARFFCSDRIAVTPEEKRALRGKTGSDAVEMESRYIHAICSERNIPCVTIRVISDSVDEEMPLDFNALVTSEDRISFVKLALALLKSPGKVPALLAFQKRTVAAAKKLARVLRNLLLARA